MSQDSKRNTKGVELNWYDDILAIDEQLARVDERILIEQESIRAGEMTTLSQH